MALTIAQRAHFAAGPIGFGGAPLGNLYRSVTDADARDLVAHAYASGTRHFDTAPHYGNGLSEQRIGQVLRGIPRSDYQLSTKVGRVLQQEQNAPTEQHGYVDVLPFAQHFDYSRGGVLRSLEDSVNRLGIARIDIVYVHDIDAVTHAQAWPAHMRAMLDEGLPALAQAKADGWIGAYGIGVNDVDICSTTLRHADLDVILLAGRYTLADQSALAQLLPECLRRDVSVVLGGPFNSGILATGAYPADGSLPSFDYAPAGPDVVAHVAAVEALCAQFNVSLKAAALQFPRAHPAVVNVLCGMRSIAEFDENRAAAHLSIPGAFWQALHARGLVDETAPLPKGDS